MDKRKFISVVGVGLAAALVLTASPANAEPSGAPTYRDIVGTGSDTSQDVMNAMSDVVVNGSGTKILGSYNAVPLNSTITTKDNPACQNITRPNNSGQGVQLLVDSLAAANDCVQFARSSSNNSASYAGKNLTYIPFALDEVTFAERADTTIGFNLTIAQLTSVYNCQIASYQPLLPKYGSGTRKTFLQFIGLTDAANFTSQAGHTCVKDTDASGNAIEENDGRYLTAPNQLIPYSVGQYLSQLNRVVSDIRGQAVPGRVNNIPAIPISASHPMTRPIYNVIPQAKESDPVYQNVFIGANSQICSNSQVITRYGFGTISDCGSTSLHTP